jgi:hypothetical protein
VISFVCFLQLAGSFTMPWFPYWQKAFLKQVRRDREIPPDQEEAEKFIDSESSGEQEDDNPAPAAKPRSALRWKITTTLLAVVVLVQTALNPPMHRVFSYETGFSSDLGIIVLPSSHVMSSTRAAGLNEPILCLRVGQACHRHRADSFLRRHPRAPQRHYVRRHRPE